MSATGQEPEQPTPEIRYAADGSPIADDAWLPWAGVFADMPYDGEAN